MTEAEWRAFANAGTRTGKIAVTRKDGRPHVTPVWFLIDDGDGDEAGGGGGGGGGTGPRVVFNTGLSSLKGRALSRDPRFALCVDDQEPPYSFVLLECTAELVEDPVALQNWATRLGVRYMGEKRGPEFGARNAVPGECLVFGRVDRVTAQARLTE
ncbi:PPOX class F420-dependent oxidoreductase [Actinacidiphila yeochonensis]|uniref:PPOX class F420-dependent oxidoreductase n=1 Tax=Actinacidiphila yeochonensis TaxID=89050 RepID=UPI000AE43AC9